MRFEFATAQHIVFGAGKLKEIGPFAKQLGKNALVVTGKGVDRATRIITLLKDQGLATHVFSVGGEPEVEIIEEGVKRAEAACCELARSYGGGSDSAPCE